MTPLDRIVELTSRRVDDLDTARSLLTAIHQIALRGRTKIPATEQLLLPIHEAQESERKLSPAMQQALNFMRAHGRLVRWPGGFWTYPECPTTRVQQSRAGVHHVPEWFAGVKTLEALEARGLTVLQKVNHTFYEIAFPTPQEI